MAVLMTICKLLVDDVDGSSVVETICSLVVEVEVQEVRSSAWEDQSVPRSCPQLFLIGNKVLLYFNWDWLQIVI